ncbi:phosphoinositide phospholipase PIPLC protein [Toxoplasma gondii ARI]|uniref:Phosphoinositide phospholipase PIPLC protein n=4 Tax=Toxoplasma gondii TaxID=5811 RepID=A0A086JGL4_TOXGO|nr:phosphoinositide phospholipase PIPLC protein [Toxoplasma gondii FOU]KYF49862.1 phosphoinositide phospholipase PIPLC protein [Toxoplasma gondii ARI]RQX72173.1 phosphoinositide phospholipase PIPLC [Toxoplasma gondii CAST]
MYIYGTAWIACVGLCFQRSKFPIILSLEMHCSTKQRIRIAEILEEILQDQIYRCHPTSPQPSPEQLLCKFILKGKVPNERGEMVEEGDEEDLQLEELELRMAKSLEMLGDGQQLNADISSSFVHALEGQGTLLSLPDTPPGLSISQLSSSSLATAEAPEAEPRGREGEEVSPLASLSREEERGTSDPKANRLSSSPTSKSKKNRNLFLKKSSSFTCAISARSRLPSAQSQEAPQPISEETPRKRREDSRAASVEWRRARTVDRLHEETRENERRGPYLPEAETEHAGGKTKRGKSAAATPGAASADSKSERLKTVRRYVKSNKHSASDLKTFPDRQ